MQTITTKRSANVSRSVAMAELLKAHPTADVLSLVKRGNQYVATLRLAESEPPKEKEAPAEEAAEDAAIDSAEDSADDSAEDSESDDEGGAPDLGGGGDEGGEGDMPGMKTPSADESLAQIVHLLQQLVHGGGMGAPKPPMPHGGPAGGPPAPPMGGGGMGGPGGHPAAPPLPPPAQKHPQGTPMAGPSFASNRRTFVATRDDAHEVTNEDAVREAHENFPGYKVAQIQRDRETNVLKVAMVKR